MTSQQPFALRIAIVWILGVCAVVVFGAFAVVKLSAFHPYAVSQGSMEPTLYRGDRIFVNEDYYNRHPLTDGDLIVIRHGDALVVKRISAVAGESIEGRSGTLIRNGKPLVEPYAEFSSDNSLDIETFPSRQVPWGEVFVTGDSRDRSLDSRAEEYGPVYEKDVVGRVSYVYWSSHPHQRGRSF